VGIQKYKLRLYVIWFFILLASTKSLATDEQKSACPQKLSVLDLQSLTQILPSEVWGFIIGLAGLKARGSLTLTDRAFHQLIKNIPSPCRIVGRLVIPEIGERPPVLYGNYLYVPCGRDGAIATNTTSNTIEHPAYETPSDGENETDFSQEEEKSFAYKILWARNLHLEDNGEQFFFCDGGMGRFTVFAYASINKPLWLARHESHVCSATITKDWIIVVLNRSCYRGPGIDLIDRKSNPVVTPGSLWLEKRTKFYPLPFEVDSEPLAIGTSLHFIVSTKFSELIYVIDGISGESLAKFPLKLIKLSKKKKEAAGKNGSSKLLVALGNYIYAYKGRGKSLSVLKFKKDRTGKLSYKRKKPIKIGGRPVKPIVVGDFLYVCNYEGNTVHGISGLTHKVEVIISVGMHPSQLIASDDFIGILSEGDAQGESTLALVNRNTQRVELILPVGLNGQFLVAHGRYLYVTRIAENNKDGELVVVDPG
jgi:hypothetical protein